MSDGRQGLRSVVPTSLPWSEPEHAVETKRFPYIIVAPLTAAAAVGLTVIVIVAQRGTGPQGTGQTGTGPVSTELGGAGRGGQEALDLTIRFIIVPPTRVIESGSSVRGRRTTIGVTIHNPSATRKFTYTFPASNAAAQLTDEFGNRYRFLGRHNSLPSHLEFEEVYPGQSVNDEFLFEPPVAKADEVTLIVAAVTLCRSKDFVAKVPIPSGYSLVSSSEARTFKDFVAKVQVPQGQEREAKRQIQAFEFAIRNYRDAMFHFPETGLGLTALRQPMMNRAGRTLGSSWIDSVPLDPWGHAYRYQYPSSHGLDVPDIWSDGPDGVPNTGDDIGNWQGVVAYRLIEP